MAKSKNITFTSSWFKKDVTLNTEGLTDNEVKVMIAVRNNEFTDAMTSMCGPWTFSVQSNSGINPKSFKGVLSSLVKKGQVEVFDNDGDTCTFLTEAGAKRYSDFAENYRCW